ncbi:MAG: methyltransferase domain-containing protein [Deltaproteobacteria bacterium]|nr:methyltransferase domain-containing protein [Deltaproteobacteria bacterium]
MKCLLPEFFKRHLKKIILPHLNSRYQKKYGCPVCGSTVADFKLLYDGHLNGYAQYGYIYPLYYWETFNFVKYRCPQCDASDRDRLYALFLRKKFDALDKSKKYKFIDFAPAPALSKMISSFNFIEYRSADLMMEHVDDRVDITNMPIYSDNSFDLLLCSHVLEHVENDLRAMKELYRILKPGGWGIIMVPILITLEKSHEDPAIISEADRWKYYGQHDHVRMYSKGDFIERLSAAGFKVHLYDVNYFSEEVFEYNGILSGSVLYVVEK